MRWRARVVAFFAAVLGACSCGRARAPAAPQRSVAEVLASSCASYRPPAAAKGAKISLWPAQMSSGMRECSCSTNADTLIERCPATDCICGKACPATLCEARDLAEHLCAGHMPDWTVMLDADQRHLEVILTTGFVGSSYVYNAADGQLVGATTFQDFGGAIPAYVMDPDAGPDAGSGEIMPVETRAGASVDKDVFRCRVCGRDVFPDPPCSAVRWNRGVPQPAGNVAGKGHP